MRMRMRTNALCLIIDLCHSKGPRGVSSQPGWGWQQAETQSPVAKTTMMCGVNYPPYLNLLQHSMYPSIVSRPVYTR